MENITGVVALGIAVGLIFANAIIFYLIIRAAVSNGSETHKRLKHAWAQTELLLAMARKQGVSDAEIRAITDGMR